MDMIEILKAVLFGIVEGITEWLPTSSTGHMILLNEFVTLNVRAVPDISLQRLSTSQKRFPYHFHYM